MHGFFPVDIFPHQALDNSILTPVLIGLVVLLIFTELFGWVFVGYVVPGYLAVIFLTFPESGIAITIEAIITYQLVVLLSEWGARAGLWSRFFGRERFLLFVYASIVVRLIMEGIVFPKVSFVLSQFSGLNFRDEFFSIGLVLVPLLANSFWKTGLSKGLAQRGTVTLIVYLVLAFVLLPYTNLNLSSFELTYENMAMDFSSAPKVYIILLTGALVASQFNVRFGWDYNGIMVPALLAIAFFMPIKVLATVAEAMSAAMVFVAITSLPGIKRLNFGGGRKITAVFFISYVLKWILASFFPTFPGMRATDLFGFGYVLPSLMAVKILQKHNSFKVVLPTIYTAFYSLLMGSLVGFAFLIGARFIETKPAKEEPTTPQQTPSDVPFLFHDMLISKAYVVRSTYALGRPADFRTLSWAAHALKVALGQNSASKVCEAINRMDKPIASNGFRCIVRRSDSGEYAVLMEAVDDVSKLQGLGYMIFSPQKKGSILLVPYPIREPLSIEAAYILSSLTNARAIIFAGIDDPYARSPWGDATKDRLSVMQMFYERLNGDDVVMVRASNRETARWYIRYKLPESVNTKTLRDRIGEVELLWHAPANAPIQWRTSMADFSVIEIPDKLLKEASSRQIFAGKLKKLAAPISISGLIEKWIVQNRRFILPPHRGYTAPTWQERSLLKNDVIAPLLEISNSEPKEIDRERLATARLVAKFLGYDIIWFTDRNANAEFFILTPDADQNNRGWGTFVLRIGQGKPWFFMAPRPISEKGTVAISSNWFEKSKAKALFIAGAAYNADQMRRSDILNVAAPRSMAYIAVREFLNAFGETPGFLTCMVRGTRIWRIGNSDVLISTGFEIVDTNQLPVGAARLYEFLTQQERLDATFFQGKLEQLALLGVKNPIARLVRAIHPEAYSSIWIGERLRTSIIEGEELRGMLRLLSTLKIPYTLRPDSAYEHLKDMPKPNTRCKSRRNFGEMLAEFARYNNIRALMALSRDRCIRLNAAVDLRKTQLVISAEDARMRCLDVYGSPMSDTHTCIPLSAKRHDRRKQKK